MTLIVWLAFSSAIDPLPSVVHGMPPLDFVQLLEQAHSAQWPGRGVDERCFMKFLKEKRGFAGIKRV
jgi:hypothetical protein